MKPVRVIPMFVVVFVSLALAACGQVPPRSQTPPQDVEPGEMPLAPPAAGKGIQLTLRSRLEAGVEVERCQFVVAPAEGLAIQNQKSGYGPGLHHLLLYRTTYTSIPTADLSGRPFDTTGVFDCPAPAGDWQATGIIGGTQGRGGEDIGANLPEDVAIIVQPNEILLINVHMLNTTPQPLDVEARLNLYTLAREKVRHEAGVTFFYNLFIKVPPAATSSARMSCPVPSDVTLVNGQSHMHARGQSFVANIVDAQGTFVEKLYESRGYEDVPEAVWNPGKVLRAGSAIDYQCNYRNNETRTVTQGFTSRDEMCMFLGVYYPRNDAFERCNPADGIPGLSLSANVIGSGTKSGQETAGCFASTPVLDETGNNVSGAFSSCLLDACAPISRQSSTAAQCLMSGGFGQCKQACAEPTEACGNCVASACQQAFGALAQARCVP